MCFDGWARTATHDMWCTTATATTTTRSTVPMRPSTCSDRPTQAVAHDMCYSYSFFGCAWVVIRQKQLSSYYSYLANCLEYIIQYDTLGKDRIKVLVPLWVYRRHSLPSRRRRQHDVLALVPPTEGTAGATS